MLVAAQLCKSRQAINYIRARSSVPSTHGWLYGPANSQTHIPHYTLAVALVQHTITSTTFARCAQKCAISVRRQSRRQTVSAARSQRAFGINQKWRCCPSSSRSAVHDCGERRGLDRSSGVEGYVVLLALMMLELEERFLNERCVSAHTCPSCTHIEPLSITTPMR